MTPLAGRIAGKDFLLKTVPLLSLFFFFFNEIKVIGSIGSTLAQQACLLPQGGQGFDRV